MIINLSPIFSSEPALVLSVKGDALYVNGDEFDFSPLQPGYSLPADAIDSVWFAGPVSKDAHGVLTVTIRFPHPMDADESMRFPVPITVTDDGPVALPLYTPPADEVPLSNEESVNEDRLQLGVESADTGTTGEGGSQHSGDSVPSVDGLDGNTTIGDIEASSGDGIGAAG